MTRAELVDLMLEIEGETERTIRVRNLKDISVWLPKSQVEIDERHADRRGRIAEVTMPPSDRQCRSVASERIEASPRWLAEEKELV